MDDEGEVGSLPKDQLLKVPDKKVGRNKFKVRHKDGVAKTTASKEQQARDAERAEEARMQVEREEQERQRRQEETGRRRTMQQVLVDARSLELVMDEYAVTADPGLRQDLLQQGLSVSIHGLDIVGGEPFTQDMTSYLASLKTPEGWDPRAALQALRYDPVSLKIFLSAESRMLADLGLTQNAVARTRTSLAYVIVDARTISGRQLSGQVSELREELVQDRERLQNPAGHRKIWRRLTGVLEAFGGILIMLGDQFVGTAAAPATAGVSVYGAVLSQFAGGGVFTDGVRRARRALRDVTDVMSGVRGMPMIQSLTVGLESERLTERVLATIAEQSAERQRPNGGWVRAAPLARHRLPHLNA